MSVHLRVTWLQKAASYLFPIRLFSGSSSINPYLELICYRGRIQLATEHALYSDGIRYMPFRVAFRNMERARLEALSEVLILGSGLGSIVQLLTERYGARPRFHLVELDECILKWALAFLSGRGVHSIVPHCSDAFRFMKANRQAFDLICIDVFIDRVVPSGCGTSAFFEQVKRSLAKNGSWIMNYIINDERKWEHLLLQARAVFPDMKYIQKRGNIILTGSVSG